LSLVLIAKTEIVDLTESYNCKTLQSVEVFITQFNICRNIYFRKVFVVLIQ